MGLQISSLLRSDCIIFPLQATSKYEAIDELCELFASRHGIPNPSQIANAAKIREDQQGTTAIWPGFAFPHAASHSKHTERLAIGIFPSPIEWADGKSVSAVFFVTGSERAGVDLVVLLLRELFNNAAVRQYFLAASSASEVYEFMVRVGIDLGVPEGMKLRSICEELSGAVHCLAWRPDGGRLASAGADDENLVRIWDDQCHTKQTLGGFSKEVLGLAWSPDGEVLAAGSVDETVRVWKGSGLELVGSYDVHARVHALAWDPLGQFIAVAGHTMGVKRFSAEGWHTQPNLERMETLEPAFCVRWSPDGNLLAASGGRSPPSVHVWDGRKARRLKQLLPDTETILTIRWSHDSAWLAAGSDGGRIDVWSTRDWRSVTILNGQTDQITDLDFSHNDQFLSSKSADGTVVLWDTGSWSEVARLPDPGTGYGLFAPLAFHPNRMMLATLGRNGNTLRIWEINAMSMTPKPRPHSVPQKEVPLPLHLVDAVKEQRVILFAGAGISIEALGVTTRSVRQVLVQGIKEQYPDYDDSQRSFEEVAEEWASLHDLLTLQNKLAGLIPRNWRLSPAHKAAIELFPKIVTTNWDLLFDDAYQDAVQSWQKLVADNDVDNINAGSRALLKIHGCASQPTSLIATSKQFETYHLTHPRLLECVGQLLGSYTTLFVGYGLGDEHIRRVISTAVHNRGERAYRSYVVGFFDEVRANLLRKRQFEVIQADASSFLPRLAARVRQA